MCAQLRERCQARFNIPLDRQYPLVGLGAERQLGCRPGKARERSGWPCAPRRWRLGSDVGVDAAAPGSVLRHGERASTE